MYNHTLKSSRLMISELWSRQCLSGAAWSFTISEYGPYDLMCVERARLAEEQEHGAELIGHHQMELSTTLMRAKPVYHRSGHVAPDPRAPILNLWMWIGSLPAPSPPSLMALI